MAQKNLLLVQPQTLKKENGDIEIGSWITFVYREAMFV
jgi:hypothetical protein